MSWPSSVSWLASSVDTAVTRASSSASLATSSSMRGSGAGRLPGVERPDPALQLERRRAVELDGLAERGHLGTSSARSRLASWLGGRVPSRRATVHESPLLRRDGGGAPAQLLRVLTPDVVGARAAGLLVPHGEPVRRPACSLRTMRALRPAPRSSSHAMTVPGSLGTVQRQHGVRGAGGRHDVGRRGGHVEVVGVDLGRAAEVGGDPRAADRQLDRAGRRRPGTGCA